MKPESHFRAGSSTELGRVRVFAHDGAGGLLGGPLWLDVPAPWDTVADAFGGEAGLPTLLAV